MVRTGPGGWVALKALSSVMDKKRYEIQKHRPGLLFFFASCPGDVGASLARIKQLVVPPPQTPAPADAKEGDAKGILAGCGKRPSFSEIRNPHYAESKTGRS